MGQPVPFVDLSRQHGPIMEELERAIAAVVAGGDFILGREVAEFERDFADFVGVAHAVGVGSGTAALTIALRAGGLGPGDQVLVPAHTYIASALAVVHAGAEPVFCDVERSSGLIDPDSAARAIGPRTRALIAVDLYGQAVEPGPLAALADEHDLLLLEDSAQAHGARIGGRAAGSLGEIAAFSFYPSKNLGAFGDGGMICTDDEELAAAARRWRHLGQEGKGEHVLAGYNERLDTIQAAILARKLPHLEAWNDSRRRAATWYRERLAGLALLPQRQNAEDVFHIFPVRVPGGAPERDRVRALLAQQGIGTAVHYWPAVHRQAPFAAPEERSGQDLPEAEAWAAEELSLPMFADITEAEVEAVCAALERAIGPVPAVEG